MTTPTIQLVIDFLAGDSETAIPMPAGVRMFVDNGILFSVSSSWPIACWVPAPTEEEPTKEDLYIVAGTFAALTAQHVRTVKVQADEAVISYTTKTITEMRTIAREREDMI